MKKPKTINVLAEPESYQSGYRDGKEEARRMIMAHLRIIRAGLTIRNRAKVLNIIEMIRELEL